MGPFAVFHSVGPVAYELELPKVWKIHNVFHTSLLRPFKTSKWSSPQEVEDAEIEVEADEPFDVEKLLRWR